MRIKYYIPIYGMLVWAKDRNKDSNSYSENWRDSNACASWALYHILMSIVLSTITLGIILFLSN